MPRALYFLDEEKAVSKAPLAVLFSTLIGTAPATAISPVTGPPNFRLAAPAPVVVAAVDNGDFSRGLDGWRSAGREPPEVVAVEGGLAAVLRLNTTLTSPPFAVPIEAQAITVVARAAAGGALLQAVALPEDGSAVVALGTIAPDPTRRVFRLPAAGVRGRTVRLSLDPVAAIGRAVEVGRVGPMEVVAPHWSVDEGVADPLVSGARRALRVAADPLRLASSPFRAGPAARALIVAVRGDGRVTATAGAGSRHIVATPSWRDLRLPLSGRKRTTLVIRAVPGTDPLHIADLGLVVRETSVSGLVLSRRGLRVTVRGRLVPAGGGLRVSLHLSSGRRVAAARSTSTGHFRLRARVDGRSARLLVTGDRTRIGTRRALRLPAPPQRP